MCMFDVLQLPQGLQVRGWKPCYHLRAWNQFGVVRGLDIEVSVEKLLCIVFWHQDKTLSATVVQGSARTELFAWELAKLYAVAALQLATALNKEAGQHSVEFVFIFL
eukprot:PhM_4_TR1732/c2_g1_i2/m.86910